jgi:hypothetical protein
MTTLTATLSSQFACLLSESQLSDDETYIKMPSIPKVTTQGSWVIAGSGWNRPGDILQYAFTWPIVPSQYVKRPHELTSWVIKSVIPKIGEALQKNKSMDYDKGTASLDAEFIVATHGRAFLIDSGFGVTPISDFFVSGSGGKIALGAIEALKCESPDAWDSGHDLISKKAIEAACKFDLYSSGAIRGFKSLPNGKIIPLNY